MSESRARRPGPLWLAMPAVALLLYFMVWPMLQVLQLSVSDETGYTARFLAKAAGPGLYTKVLGNTFAVALQVTLWCIVLGYPLTLWLARLEGRRQRIAAFFVLIPFWTSALIKNFSWMVLLGRNGVVGNALMALGWDMPPELLFSRGTVIFAMTHTMMPLAIITMLPVVQEIDRRLPAAALTLGASGAQGFWMVLVPLSMRGISAAALLVFVASLGFFITPELVGGPDDVMIGQLIIMQINLLQNWSQGAALAAVLLVAVLLTVVVFNAIFGIAGTANTSARFAQSPVRRTGLAAAGLMARIFTALSPLAPAVLTRWGLHLYAGLMLLVLMLPVFAFIPMSFSAAAELSFPPKGFSLRWYHELFASPLWTGAIMRSIGIGFATAAVVVVIGGGAAVALAKSQSRLATPVFLLLLTPMIVPGIVIAISLFYLFAAQGLVATNTGIIIGHCVIALPIVFVILLSTFKGYNWRLNEAASTLGASVGQTWRMVTLPLMKGGLAAGFVTGFLQSFEELTVALFIGGGMKTTLPRQMWDSILLQATPLIAAASVVMLAIVLFFFMLMELSQARRSGKSIS